MTAAAGREAQEALPASAPRQIRAALLPEEVGAFDSEWRSALRGAAETLDLTDVYRTLHRWCRIAQLTRADPGAHRRMLEAAARAWAGEPIPTVSSDTVAALIRERLPE